MRDKSLHQLRVIAQSFGIKDIFQKTDIQLRQEIELAQQSLIPPTTPPIPRPEYDARLMTKPPSKKCTEDTVNDLLKHHIERGLHLTFPEPERWHMKFDKKEDTGTMRMPLRTILTCAERIMA